MSVRSNPMSVSSMLSSNERVVEQHNWANKSNLINVISTPFNEAIDNKGEKRAELGSVIYDPFINPATLLDSELLSNHLGGIITAKIDYGWLQGINWELGDHQNVQSHHNDSHIFDLIPFRKRKLWGTEVYTDDSDLLAIAVHSGYLRILPNSHPPTLRGRGSLVLKLIVGPTLLRYESTVRQGLKSRNWGNSHDGQSLIVHSLTLSNVRHASYSSIISTHNPTGNNQTARTLPHQAPHRPILIPPSPPSPFIDITRTINITRLYNSRCRR